MNQLLILGPVTLVVAVYLTFRTRQPALQVGLVDVPGGRKLHSGQIPLNGGMCIFVAFAFAALLIDGSLEAYRPMFAGMGLLLITGVLDDLQDLGATEKILLHLFAALLLVLWGELRIEHLGVLPVLGQVDLGIVAVPFTLLCVVGLINAVNMLDGADGMAGGVLVVILFWFTMIGMSAANFEAMLLPAILAFGVVGFLVFNMPTFGGRQASVFMGDSGSTMLGFAVAWFAVDLAFKQAISIPPVTIAWILALPVFDTIVLMLRRVAKGQSPMMPDREHVHHIFQRAGFGPASTTCICILIAFVMGAVGVCGWWFGVPSQWLWPPLIAVFIVHVLFVQHAWRVTRILRYLRARGPVSSIEE